MILDKSYLSKQLNWTAVAIAMVGCCRICLGVHCGQLHVLVQDPSAHMAKVPNHKEEVSSGYDAVWYLSQVSLYVQHYPVTRNSMH